MPLRPTNPPRPYEKRGGSVVKPIGKGAPARQPVSISALQIARQRQASSVKDKTMAHLGAVRDRVGKIKSDALERRIKRG